MHIPVTIVDMHKASWTPTQVATHILTLLQKQGCQSQNNLGCAYRGEHPETKAQVACGVGLVLPDELMPNTPVYMSLGLLIKHYGDCSKLDQHYTAALAHYSPTLSALQGIHDSLDSPRSYTWSVIDRLSDLTDLPGDFIYDKIKDLVTP